jgi:hypothetical protein
MCLQKDKVDNLTVETDRGSRNMRNKGDSVRWTIITNRTIVKYFMNFVSGILRH